MLKFFKEICFSELVLFQEILHKRFLQMLVGGTIAGASLICVGIASVPVPDARVPAGVAACVILLIDIID